MNYAAFFYFFGRLYMGSGLRLYGVISGLGSSSDTNYHQPDCTEGSFYG